LFLAAENQAIRQFRIVDNLTDEQAALPPSDLLVHGKLALPAHRH
jgi:hypothetical protein